MKNRTRTHIGVNGTCFVCTAPGCDIHHHIVPMNVIGHSPGWAGASSKLAWWPSQFQGPNIILDVPWALALYMIG